MPSKLVPWVHFVPIKTDFSDLETQLDHCLANPELCHKINLTSKLFALQFCDIDKERNIALNVCKNYFVKTISISKNEYINTLLQPCLLHHEHDHYEILLTMSYSLKSNLLPSKLHLCFLHQLRLIGSSINTIVAGLK